MFGLIGANKAMFLLRRYWENTHTFHADGPGESWSVATVSAVEDGEARLPCNLDPGQEGDSVYLVLWYR